MVPGGDDLLFFWNRSVQNSAIDFDGSFFSLEVNRFKGWNPLPYQYQKRLHQIFCNRGCLPFS